MSLKKYIAVVIFAIYSTPSAFAADLPFDTSNIQKMCDSIVVYDLASEKIVKSQQDTDTLRAICLSPLSEPKNYKEGGSMKNSVYSKMSTKLMRNPRKEEKVAIYIRYDSAGTPVLVSGTKPINVLVDWVHSDVSGILWYAISQYQKAQF